MANDSSGAEAAAVDSGAGPRILAPEDLVNQDALNPRQRLVVRALLGALAKGKLDLPMLPSHAAKALEVASNSESDFGEYEAAIKPNAAMTTQLLKAANSPLYGAARQISSVRQAMLMLGTTALSQLVMQVVVHMQKMGSESSPEFIESEQSHGLGVAHFAQHVAREVGMEPGEAFLCGLLHDMGRLLFPELARARSMNLDDEQAAILSQELHPALGYQVCVAWGLPELVLDAVSRHHAFRATDSDRGYSKIGHVLAVSEAAMAAQGLGGSEQNLFGTADSGEFEQLAAELGVGEGEIGRLRGEAEAIAERLRS